MAAIVYDCVLLLAVWFAATAALLPFSGGEAISSGHGLYTAYLLAVSFVYFGWFWTHGGQTLGMRSWHLGLEGADENTVTWRQALLRFVGALVSWLALGAGYLWLLVDPERRTWHDRLSGTRITDRS